VGGLKQELNTNRYPIVSCKFLENGVKAYSKKYEKEINSNILLIEEKITQSTRKFSSYVIKHKRPIWQNGRSVKLFIIRPSSLNMFN
jgi:hypothetical protein